MLSEPAWLKVDSRFGPLTLDMMSLDSNAQKDASGNLLKHFTPFPTPLSAGVNVFAQVIQQEENAYVFPPLRVGGSPAQVLGTVHRELHYCSPSTRPASLLVANSPFPCYVMD